MPRPSAQPGTHFPNSRAALLLFSLSGFAALGYQIIWARRFAAGLGHEFPAVLAIVTAFMCGMGLGAFLFEKFCERRGHPSTWFGVLELSIGSWAVISALLTPAFLEQTRALIGFAPSSAKQTLFSFVSVLVIILPATAAMGATLPAASLLFYHRPAKLVSVLYACNTAGAVFGALATAFLLMPALGLRNALFLLAALNIGCGLAALRLFSGIAPTREPSIQHKSPPLFTLFCTGLLGIGFEVIAIRLLSNVLENTLYTFASVLAIFLLGNSFGAYAHHRFASRFKSSSFPFLLIAFTSLACGACALLLPQFYSALNAMFGFSLISVALAEALASGVVLFVPTLFMGWIFAQLASSASLSPGGLSRAVASNSFGAMFAPFAFGTLLLPMLGTKGSLLVIALGYLLLAPKRMLLAVTLPLLAFAAAFLPARITPVQLRPDERIIYFRDGALATVTVLESTNSHRVLKVNNRFQMGGTAARLAEQRHADIPLLLHPNPKDALFLGLGTGITFNTAQEYGGLNADGVELVPEVARAMPLFSEHADNFAPPGLQVFVADARRFVQMAPRQYDVVVADLFHPAQDGAGFLYTSEHFAAIRGRLKSGGLFCQWLPLYQLDLQGLRIITATFLKSFPHSSAWLLRPSLETPVVGLIGTLEPHQFKFDSLTNRLTEPALEFHLKNVALGDPIRLFGSFLAGPDELKRFAAGLPASTDDRPSILFYAPRHLATKSPAARLLDFIEQTSSAPRSVISGEESALERLEKYLLARNHYLRGLAIESGGNMEQAITAYVQSAAMSPDFTSGYAQGITIATALVRSNPAAARDLLQRLAAAQPQRRAAQEILQRFFPQDQITDNKPSE